ncbi:hypothetical protein [Endozoicomonas lisbonensis]|uniref:Uncharacterized protein n=1 Tax=Endozoicomonas lisbonensis TaxID=3120522 RepID=A0ABV2SHC6_9GAMM
MKVSMARAYFKQHMGLASIKEKFAQKFGFKVKTNEQVEAKIPKGVETDAPLTHPKPIKSRQTKKAKPSAWANWQMARSKKQSRKLFGEMLQNWMSDKPEKAVQSYVKFRRQLEKTMTLEKYEDMSADDYANKTESVLMDFIASLKTKEPLEKIKNDLRHGGKIYRGLCALTYLQNGTNDEGKLWRHSLSDKANAALTSINTLCLDLFKNFLPLKNEALQEALMKETDPERTNQSEQEVEDIKAAFSALKKIK